MHSESCPSTYVTYFSAMETPMVIRAAHVHNSQPKKRVGHSCTRESIAGTVTLTAASDVATVTMDNT